MDGTGTYGYGLAHLRLSLLRYVLLDKELDCHSMSILEYRLGRLHTSAEGAMWGRTRGTDRYHVAAFAEPDEGGGR